jgi:hypothetical protein
MATKKRTTKKAAPKKTTKKAPAAKASAQKPAVKKEKKLSALDAAAQVLAESKQALTTKEMIEQMAEKKLWTSPGGATPHATLYSAILREINAKGKDARFKKPERGKFAKA